MKELLDQQLESEIQKLDKVKKIQEEVDNLNKSINACIDIVSESVGNSQTLEKLRRLKEENEASYSRTTNDIDEVLENSKDNINQIRIEKKHLEENEEEKKESKEGTDE